MINLTDQNFDEEIMKAEKPVLIDFWASWCQPCFMLSPILEKLAEEEYKEKFTFAKVNVGEASLVAQRYGINQIPVVILFKDGKAFGGFLGFRPEPEVRKILDKMLTDIWKK